VQLSKAIISRHPR